MLLILRNYCVIIVVFLFIVTVLEGNCLYHIVSVLNHTISSFSFSRSKSFCWLVFFLYMYLYCCVCRHFPPLSLLYFAVYFLSLSRTNARRVRHTFAKASRLHRIRWSPAVCPHVFHPVRNSILCCIFIKKANWLPVSLVIHGLRPSDSVWVYWTTLKIITIHIKHRLQLLGNTVYRQAERDASTRYR